MTCKHCKAKVEQGLLQLQPVREAVADPEKNTLTLEADEVSESEVRAAVEGLGYTFKGRIIRF
jgi:copper chaperone CopZ